MDESRLALIAKLYRYLSTDLSAVRMERGQKKVEDSSEAWPATSDKGQK